MSSSNALRDRRPGPALAFAVLLALSCLASIFGTLASAAPGADDRLDEVEFQAAAVQGNGKVVVAGSASTGAFVARLNARGRPDQEFGDEGIMRPAIAGDRLRADAVAVGAGGEITVSFSRQDAHFSALLRLDAAGNPDPRFGTGGVVTRTSSSIPELAAMADGAVLIRDLITGEADDGSAILRVRADGTVDPGFAIRSEASKTGYGLGGFEVGADGRIYVATLKPADFYPATQKQIVVSRFLSNGDPDPSFGKDGVAAFDRGYDSRPDSLQGRITGFAVTPGGDVLLVLQSWPYYREPPPSPQLFSVADDGASLVDQSSVRCAGQIAIGPDGAVTVAGVESSFRTQASPLPPVSTGCVEKLTPAGAVEDRVEERNVGRILAVQPDGRVLAAGTIVPVAASTWPSAYLTSLSTDGVDRGFGMAFLPTLGCRGRNPTIVAQPTWTSDDESLPTGPPDAFSTEGPDVVLGSPEGDEISASYGKDLVCSGAGRDKVWGGPERDTIFGGPGRDTIFGGRGRDAIFGGPGRDTIFGGPGRDAIFGGAGRDKLLGGPGLDRVRQ